MQWLANAGAVATVVLPEGNRPEAEALEMLVRGCVRSSGFAGQQVRLAVEDSYKRLIFPSIEREIRAELKERMGRIRAGDFDAS